MDNTGASLKSVDKFCYLSDMLSVDVDADMELQHKRDGTNSLFQASDNSACQ